MANPDAKLDELPEELILWICEQLYRTDLWALSMVSRKLNSVANTKLYENVNLNTKQHGFCFLRTVVQQPTLGALTRILSVDTKETELEEEKQVHCPPQVLSTLIDQCRILWSINGIEFDRAYVEAENDLIMEAVLYLLCANLPYLRGLTHNSWLRRNHTDFLEPFYESPDLTFFEVPKLPMLEAMSHRLKFLRLAGGHTRYAELLELEYIPESFLCHLFHMKSLETLELEGFKMRLYWNSNDKKHTYISWPQRTSPIKILKLNNIRFLARILDKLFDACESMREVHYSLDYSDDDIVYDIAIEDTPGRTFASFLHPQKLSLEVVKVDTSGPDDILDLGCFDDFPKLRHLCAPFLTKHISADDPTALITNPVAFWNDLLGPSIEYLEFTDEDFGEQDIYFPLLLSLPDACPGLKSVRGHLLEDLDAEAQVHMEEIRTKFRNTGIDFKITAVDYMS